MISPKTREQIAHEYDLTDIANAPYLITVDNQKIHIIEKGRRGKVYSLKEKRFTKDLDLELDQDKWVDLKYGSSLLYLPDQKRYLVSTTFNKNKFKDLDDFDNDFDIITILDSEFKENGAFGRFPELYHDSKFFLDGNLYRIQEYKGDIYVLFSHLPDIFIYQIGKLTNKGQENSVFPVPKSRYRDYQLRTSKHQTTKDILYRSKAEKINEFNHFYKGLFINDNFIRYYQVGQELSSANDDLIYSYSVLDYNYKQRTFCECKIWKSSSRLEFIIDPDPHEGSTDLRFITQDTIRNTLVMVSGRLTFTD
ncbi:MAG: hypothetical protein R2824_34940 [Saprospiraceae bacterium]|nr:hypothetical protein [Lewinella sp.]